MRRDRIRAACCRCPGSGERGRGFDALVACALALPRHPSGLNGAFCPTSLPLFQGTRGLRAVCWNSMMGPPSGKAVRGPRGCARPADQGTQAHLSEILCANLSPAPSIVVGFVVRPVMVAEFTFVITAAVEDAENRNRVGFIVHLERNHGAAPVIRNAQTGTDVVTSRAAMWKCRQALARTDDRVGVALCNGRGRLIGYVPIELNRLSSASGAKTTVYVFTTVSLLAGGPPPAELEPSTPIRHDRDQS